MIQKSYMHTPRTIKKELDRHVIGQEEPKKAIAQGAYEHYM
jgi:ATP-dependent protease Clp ATPase subunit